MDTATKKYSNLTIYRRVLREAWPCWPYIAGFLALSLLATPLALLIPLPLKIAVDSIIGDKPAPWLIRQIFPASSPTALLIAACGMVVLFAFLTQVQKFAADMLKTYAGEQLIISFRSRLFRHVQRLSLAYHDRQGSSDSSYRIQYDAPSIQVIVVDSLVPFVSAVFMLGCMLYVIATINLKLAAVALAVSPFMLLLTTVYKNRLRTQWRKAKKLESSAQSIVQETLGALRVVKAFTREEHEHDRFIHESRTGMKARLTAAFQEHCYTLLVGLATATGTAAVLFVGVQAVRNDALSLGNLLLVMAYLGKLYDPLKTLGKQLATRQKSIASAERAFSLLDEEFEVAERPNAKPLVRAKGAITFRDVSFAYGNGKPILESISLDIPAGACIGIAGKTGAGKTTLMNLLARFYDPSGGEILLDGIDLRDYKLADLRNQFAIVLQEPVLFSASIEENIAYGRPGATHADIVAAAKSANAHEFIEALPQGYQTQVGERGMSLSGGERQRISLARAFLRDAPILILDEPTSSVDTKTEAVIMDAMRRLIAGRTTFMIAHRLGTLSMCDQILRFETGRLISESAARIEHPDVAMA